MNQEQIAGIASVLAALLGGLNEQKPKVWDGLRFELTGKALRGRLNLSRWRLDAILEKHGERYADFVRRQKAERELLLENLDDDAVYVLGWEDLHRWFLDLEQYIPEETEAAEPPTSAAN